MHAKINLMEASGDADTFDDLADLAQELLVSVCEDLQPSGDRLVILLGYSPRAEQFTAHLYASDDGFTPKRITDATWAHPMPWIAAPTTSSLSRIASSAGPGSSTTSSKSW